VSERISEDFWNRKSLTWEAELGTIDGEIRRVQQPTRATSINAEKILELAKRAVILYKSQDSAEQRRLLETGFRTARLTVELFVRPTLRRSTYW
jgi:hypothetical protein